MPPERQRAATAATLDETAILVRTLAMTMPAGCRFDAHEHSWAQLIYASSGVMTVRTASATWVVPPKRAILLPAGLAHEVEMSTAVAMRTLYLRADLAAAARTCRVVAVTPLLRELILEAIRRQMLSAADAPAERLAWVLVDQLRDTPQAPLDLRHPVDARAQRVAERVLADPGANSSLAELCAGVGASTRTVERLFRRETGHTFGRWRAQVRMLHAVKRLASGAQVSSAAYEVGYDSVSAFIATFKRTFGCTPGSYYASAATDTG